MVTGMPLTAWHVWRPRLPGNWSASPPPEIPLSDVAGMVARGEAVTEFPAQDEMPVPEQVSLAQQAATATAPDPALRGSSRAGSA